MHTIYRAIKAVLAWLNEPQPAWDCQPPVRDWADLPAHHPCRD